MSSTSSVPKLFVNFFGLMGPNGPLPIHLTEYARERLQHARLARIVQQVRQQLAAHALFTQIGMNADIEQMRFICAKRHDPIAGNLATEFQHPAQVANPHAIAKDPLAPRKRVGGALEGPDRRDVADLHQPTRADQ
jgi:hypothetical protein